MESIRTPFSHTVLLPPATAISSPHAAHSPPLPLRSALSRPQAIAPSISTVASPSCCLSNQSCRASEFPPPCLPATQCIGAATSSLSRRSFQQADGWSRSSGCMVTTWCRSTRLEGYGG